MFKADGGIGIVLGFYTDITVLSIYLLSWKRFFIVNIDSTRVKARASSLSPRARCMARSFNSSGHLPTASYLPGLQEKRIQRQRLMGLNSF